MSNGDKDLKRLSAGSKTRLELVTSHGRQVTSNLSRCAKQEEARLEALTSSSSHLCQFPMKLDSEGQKSAQRRAQRFSGYSMNDLANMDNHGIKIVGVSFDFDEHDDTWASY